MKTVLFEAQVGSHTYGTNVATSDVDTMTVFKYPVDTYLASYESVNVRGKGDETEYEIGKFVYLCGSANPTILSLLFSDTKFTITTTPAFEEFRTLRNKFLTKKCKDTFTGYARQQLKKALTANQRATWEKKDMQRLQPIDFCYVILDNAYTKQGVIPLTQWLKDWNLQQTDITINKLNHTKEGHQLYRLHNPGGICVDESNTLRVSATPIDEKPVATLLYNQDAYGNHCKEYGEYLEQLGKRNKQRYIDNGDHTYDVKNLMHTVRLVHMAKEIASGQGFLLDRRDIDADYLLQIRKGEIDLHEVFNKISKEVVGIDKLFEDSSLPEDHGIDLTYWTIKLRKQ